jgi:hypothetical protein
LAAGKESDFLLTNESWAERLTHDFFFRQFEIGLTRIILVSGETIDTDFRSCLTKVLLNPTFNNIADSGPLVDRPHPDLAYLSVKSTEVALLFRRIKAFESAVAEKSAKGCADEGHRDVERGSARIPLRTGANEGLLLWTLNRTYERPDCSVASTHVFDI